MKWDTLLIRPNLIMTFKFLFLQLTLRILPGRNITTALRQAYSVRSILNLRQRVMTSLRKRMSESTDASFSVARSSSLIPAHSMMFWISNGMFHCARVRRNRSLHDSSNRITWNSDEGSWVKRHSGLPVLKTYVKQVILKTHTDELCKRPNCFLQRL